VTNMAQAKMLCCRETTLDDHNGSTDHRQLLSVQAIKIAFIYFEFLQSADQRGGGALRV